MTCLSELDAVLARMLARNPEDRYQTPREVARALARFTRRVPPLPVSEAAADSGPVQDRPGEADSRLEEFFTSLAAVRDEESVSAIGFARRLKRVSTRIWLAAAGLALAVVVGIIAWDRSSDATVLIRLAARRTPGIRTAGQSASD